MVDSDFWGVGRYALRLQIIRVCNTCVNQPNDTFSSVVFIHTAHRVPQPRCHVSLSSTPFISNSTEVVLHQTFNLSSSFRKKDSTQRVECQHTIEMIIFSHRRTERQPEIFEFDIAPSYCHECVYGDRPGRSAAAEDLNSSKRERETCVYNLLGPGVWGENLIFTKAENDFITAHLSLRT